MILYSMTATFGKLSHQTLTLEPGLNIIEAPNEWGKSTWCAFLTAMLYGVDTSARSTKTALADKERYAPWSGEPMSGSIDLRWRGRDITIQRRSKGRAVFGGFQAFETASGLPVPELTGENCGQMLLGVERSVFVRSGFLRLTDLPVTLDESLRRRLNALVTTGDESGAGDRLAQSLKELKNKCRFNKSGLLPQAEAQREELEGKLTQLAALQSQVERLMTRREDLEEHIAALENHRDALAWEDAEEDAKRVETARVAAGEAERQLARLEEACQDLPPQEQAERSLRTLRQLQEAERALEWEASFQPPKPEPPEIPAAFLGNTVEQDIRRYIALKTGSLALFWILFALGIGLGVGIALVFPWYFGLIPPVLALGLLLWRQGSRLRKRRQARLMEEKYGSADPAQWRSQAKYYEERQARYQAEVSTVSDIARDLDGRWEALRKKIEEATGGTSFQECQTRWIRVRDIRNACADARREAKRAREHADTVAAMARPAEPPKKADTLLFTQAETARLLSDSLHELRQLQLKLGQYQGQMESLGQEAGLRQQLEGIQTRICALEGTYAALTLAQETLAEAKTALQRRFAPRISQRAKELFAVLTDGRYDRLAVEQDFLVQVRTEQEDTLRGALWRSDGTVDQMYFALRLAVAEALTPEAPLILDDALARFDDTRLAAAIGILREEARHKQVVLFTCQSREAAAAEIKTDES